MVSSGCTYRFIESSLSCLPLNYDLEIRQQPERAKISVINERDRRSIEPPPIIQLHWKNCSNEELKKCLQSPFYFTIVNLVTEDNPETPLLPVENFLSGPIVSSLHRLRDIDNSDGGFFVFGDLAVKKEGRFRLSFSLFEIQEGEVMNRKTILSDAFTVFIPKQYPGPVEATFLSRTFSDQGVKMRIRKEHRLQSRKRKQANQNIELSSVSGHPTKRYYTNASKTIVTPPSYAESSSSTSSDVFFCRWQAIAPPTIQEPLHRISTPPQQSCDANKGFPNKLQYTYTEDHAQAFPSPESTLYNTISSSSSTARSKSWGQTCQNNRSQSCETTQSSHLTSPAADFTESLPLIQTPLLIERPIAKYRQNHSVNAVLTPSNSMEDLHEIATGTQSWGTRLPPLRAIMSNIQHFSKHDSSLFPLLLPPPITMNRPSMMMHEYHYC